MRVHPSPRAPAFRSCPSRLEPPPQPATPATTKVTTASADADPATPATLAAPREPGRPAAATTVGDLAVGQTAPDFSATDQGRQGHPPVR